MNPLSIFMFFFALMIWFFAALLFMTGDMNMIRRRYRYAAKMKDKKVYARKLAKAIALAAFAPALCGFTALFLREGVLAFLPGAVFILALIGALILGARIMRDELS